jgi:hypothetical protein
MPKPRRIATKENTERKEKEGHRVLEWVILNGKSTFEALFTGENTERKEKRRSSLSSLT